MRINKPRIEKNSIYRFVAIIGGITVNVLMAYLTDLSGIPLYLDCAGSIFVAALAGMLPGLITAVLTNVFSSLFNNFSIYYTVIGVIIAIGTSHFIKHEFHKKKANFFWYILSIAGVAGVLGTIFQWLLLGGPQFRDVANAASTLSEGEGFSYFLFSMIINTGLNLVDKAASVALAMLALWFIPEEIKIGIANSKWRQKPLSKTECKDIRGRMEKDESSLRIRLTYMLLLTAFSLTIGLSLINISQYFNDKKEEYKENAINASEFAASVVDPEKVDSFLTGGENTPGYYDTKEEFSRIRDSIPGVKYLYLIKIRQEGCVFIIDLDAGDDPAYENGELVEFEEAFVPYLPQLFAGEAINPIESNDRFGWVISSYTPVRNSDGVTVGYVGADASLSYASEYVG